MSPVVAGLAGASRGLGNVEARVADVNTFEPEERFDRIVSVEMMEHVRNHPVLMRRLAGWIERPIGEAG